MTGKKYTRHVGRWMCRRCLSYVRPNVKTCPVCGHDSFTVEWTSEEVDADEVEGL